MKYLDEIRAFDPLLLKEGEGYSIAYMRLPSEVRDFIRMCKERYEVVGFEYDDTLNLGVILQEKDNGSAQRER